MRKSHLLLLLRSTETPGVRTHPRQRIRTVPFWIYSVLMDTPCWGWHGGISAEDLWSVLAGSDVSAVLREVIEWWERCVGCAQFIKVSARSTLAIKRGRRAPVLQSCVHTNIHTHTHTRSNQVNGMSFVLIIVSFHSSLTLHLTISKPHLHIKISICSLSQMCTAPGSTSTHIVAAVVATIHRQTPVLRKGQHSGSNHMTSWTTQINISNPVTQQEKSLDASITLNCFNLIARQGFKSGLWFGHPSSSKPSERRCRYLAVIERAWPPAGRTDESILFATLQQSELLSDTQICTIWVHASDLFSTCMAEEWFMNSQINTYAALVGQRGWHVHRWCRCFFPRSKRFHFTGTF